MKTRLSLRNSVVRSLLLVTGLAVGTAAQAATFTVSKTADTNDGTCNADCSLREAIDAANAAGSDDIIAFAGGAIGTIQLGSALPDLSTNIDLQGPGAASLTVRGEGTADPYRIFTTSGTVTISGLTVANGRGDSVGGGIGNNLGNLTMRNCVISGNSAGDGGGIYNNEIITIENCTFSQNHGDFGGGGIYNDGFGGAAGATLTNCTFDQNTGGAGGALFCNGDGAGSVITNITGCTFTQNSGINNGGALATGAGTGTAVTDVNSSTFANNTSPFGNGGAIFSGGTSTFTGCTISGNTAASDGGGVYNNGNVTMTNCTVAGNHADVGLGGGLNGGSFTVRHSTIANNSAANASGINASNPVIGHCIIADNVTTGGVNPDLNGTVTSEGFNIIGNSTGGSGFAGTDKLNVDPLLDPAGLQNNGGPTQTIALQTSSPAINAGNPSFVPPPPFDQRGSGFFRVQGARLDIGAFEAPVLTVNDIEVTETNGGSAQAQFTVTLSALSAKTISFNAKTAAAGSPQATAGTDYTALPSTTFTIAPGQFSKTVSVTLLGDTLDENDEKFAINLLWAVNASIADDTGICTILDNDAPPTVSVSAPNVTEGNAGATPVMTFTIKLSAASARNISVQYQTANSPTFPATSGTDYTAVPLTTVIFAAGQTTKTVNVTVNGDVLDEENERIRLNLTNPVNATLGVISDGIIVDDDATPSLSINDISVNEGNSGTKLMMFTVTLSAASGRTVTVNVATGNGGTPAATAGSDYVTLASTLLNFTPGQTSKQVSVTINGDTTVEQNEKFGVILSGAVNASIADNSGIGTILNDDAPPVAAPLTEPSGGEDSE